MLGINVAWQEHHASQTRNEQPRGEEFLGRKNNHLNL